MQITLIMQNFETFPLGVKKKNQIVLQHAPYDAMVLVSLCWHLDQQIKATEGKWKVSIYFNLILHIN